MKSKKNLVIGGIIIIVLVAGALLWKGGYLGRGAGILNLGAKMTDEMYLKMTTEIAQNAIKNPVPTFQEAMLNETNKILNKYGISEVEFGMYVQALSNDEVRSAAMNEKLQQIMSELLKTGVK